MPQYIVIPLYDHTPASEVEDILAELAGLGFSHDPYRVEGTPPAPPEAEQGGRVADPSPGARA